MYSDRMQYREYQRMLVELHAMIAAGNGNSDEADALREQMEAVEPHLSESEMFRLNALSGDLSMIHNREIPDPEVVARVRVSNLPQLLINALRKKDWDELLALLRANVSSFIKPDQIAYMRAVAYEALGERAPAVAFYDEASSRARTNANYPALAMELLWKDRRYDEAYTRAKACLDGLATPGRLVIMAAGILSRRVTQDHPPSDSLKIARNALVRIENAISVESSPAIRFDGLATLGLLAAHVGDATIAAAALQKALDEGGVAAAQFAIRGLLMQELELVRGGHSGSIEERSLSRELADVVAPRFEDEYALAA